MESILPTSEVKVLIDVSDARKIGTGSGITSSARNGPHNRGRGRTMTTSGVGDRAGALADGEKSSFGLVWTTSDVSQSGQ